MGEHRADRQQCEIVGNVRNVGRPTYLSTRSTLYLSSISIDGAFLSLLHEPYIMSTFSSTGTSASHSNFVFIFNAASLL